MNQILAGMSVLAEFRNDPDAMAAEIARLREMLEAANTRIYALECHCDVLEEEKAAMQDDLDAAHRLLGLAPYPLTV
jgi:hypothetical protein